MLKRKIILITVISLLFIFGLVSIYIITTKDNKKDITGTVIVNGNSYVIIECNNKDYLVKNIKNAYQLGDEITITYDNKNVNEKTSPIEITAIKDKIIKESKNEVNENNKKIEPNNTTSTNNSDKNNIENSKNTQSNNDDNKINNNKNSVKEEQTTQNNNFTNQDLSNELDNNKSADTEVLAYVKKIENDANNGITTSLKNGFITIVDFLFYNGSIKGYTFSELTTSAKLEVLKAALFIDKKIDEIFPGYKDTISNSTNKIYTNIKNLIVSTYLNITSSICENNSELCESAKEDFQSLKSSFGFTWDLIKDLAGSGVNKLKEYYEIWSGK